MKIVLNVLFCLPLTFKDWLELHSTFVKLIVSLTSEPRRLFGAMKKRELKFGYRVTSMNASLQQTLTEAYISFSDYPLSQYILEFVGLLQPLWTSFESLILYLGVCF